jgi:hypothetical protein
MFGKLCSERDQIEENSGGRTGHASVQTTERYLGTKQDLVHAPNDAMKLRVAVYSSKHFNRSSGVLSSTM